MRFEWIIENEIAVGSFPDRNAIPELRKKGIRAIISLTEEKLPEEIIPNDMEYRHFPVKELQNPDFYTIKEFLLYADFLKTVRFPFFVHCKDGLLRSPLFAAFYLVYEGKSARKALEILEEKAGISFESEIEDKLFEFERFVQLSYPNSDIYSFYRFLELVRVLRRQCPWDREQTHRSLIPELIEEPLELVEAIKKEDFEGIREELGDVALQVLLHSVIAKEEKKFDVPDVFDGIFQKMVRRHPHVFGKSEAKDSKSVLSQWEEIKKKEKKERTIDIAKVLASLITAFEVQEDARRLGFDFDDISQIIAKIREETSETESAIENKENVSEELGDLLFSVINLARFLGIDPAHALFLSIDKFGKRFEYVKKISGSRLKSMSAEEKDELWNKAKKDV